MDDALAALHTRMVDVPDSGGEGDEEDLTNGESGELIEESQYQLVAAGPTALGQPSIVMGSGASSLGQPSTLQQPPPVRDPSVVQQQLVEYHPPSAQQAPSVAQQLLEDFAAAKAKAKTLAAKAKSSGKARAKSSAKAPAKSSAKAPSKSKSKAKAKAVAEVAKAKAIDGAGVKAKRKLNHEAARKTWRCRFPDGTSKGFTYVGDDDREAKRQEAQACLDAAYDAWASSQG